MNSPHIDLLTAKMKVYFDSVARHLKEPVKHVLTGLNARKLEGSTSAQMKAMIDPAIASHVANKDNPHNVSPSQLGSYSKAEINNLLSRRVSDGIIPVSRFGSLDYDVPDIKAATSASWIVKFNEATPLLLNGAYAVLQPTMINLTTIKSNPADTTFYIYVSIVSAAGIYTVLSTKVAETTGNMLIGTVRTNGSGITDINITKFTKFGGYRLSNIPSGQSIPSTSGLPSREAHLDPGWF